MSFNALGAENVKEEDDGAGRTKGFGLVGENAKMLQSMKIWKETVVEANLGMLFEITPGMMTLRQVTLRWTALSGSFGA
jgi:hypothetical protein